MEIIVYVLRIAVVFCVRLSICVLSHETLCFYQTISILFISYKLQACAYYTVCYVC